MSILDHLGELRKRIIVIAIAILVASLVSFAFVNHLLDILTRPAEHIDLIYTRPAEALMSQIRLSFIAGTLITLPFSLYQLMLFVFPALSKKEKKTLIPLVFFMVFLFLIGLSFGYFVVLPFALRFFLGFQTDGLSPFFTISNYISFVSSFLFGFGVVFQLPLLFWFLGRVGILSTPFLKTNRKFAVLIIAVLSAVITPPDIFSQFLMIGPLIILYEIGVKLVAVSEKKRKAIANEAD